MRPSAARVLWAVLFCSLAACGSDRAADSEPPPSPPEPAAEMPSTAPETAETRIRQLREDAERSPEDLQAQRRLAIALHETRRREEALTYFERIAKIDPTDRHLLDLALAYSSTSRLGEAEQIYRQLLDKNPEHAIAHHNLGNIAVSQADHAKAIDSYRKAIAAKPGYISAHFHLADALRLNEQFREAYKQYGQVLGLEPETPGELEIYDNALYEMAMLDLTMGATRRAADMLEALIRENPEHPNGHYAYGRALLLLGRPDDAEREFDIHLKIQEQIEPTAPVATRD